MCADGSGQECGAMVRCMVCAYAGVWSVADRDSRCTFLQRDFIIEETEYQGMCLGFLSAEECVQWRTV